MGVLLVLDTGPLGLLTNPNKTEKPEACRHWFENMAQNGARVAVPQTSYEEVCIGIQHAHTVHGIDRLNKFVNEVYDRNLWIATNRVVTMEAERLQESTKTRGKMTGDPNELNPDCKIAAACKLAPQLLDDIPQGTRCVVVTDNIKHYKQIEVECYKWQDLTVEKLKALEQGQDIWKHPQRDQEQIHEKKILLDHGINETTFRDGMKGFQVVSVDKMPDVAGNKLSGGELVELARARNFDAAITTNWEAIDQADSVARDGGKPVFLLALNGAGLKNEEAVKQSMPDLFRELENGLKEAREPNRVQTPTDLAREINDVERKVVKVFEESRKHDQGRSY